MKKGTLRTIGKASRALSKGLSSPLGKAVLVGAGLGGVAAAASVYDKKTGGITKMLGGKTMGSQLKGKPSQTSSRDYGLSRSGVARPQYRASGTYRSPLNPMSK